MKARRKKIQDMRKVSTDIESIAGPLRSRCACRKTTAKAAGDGKPRALEGSSIGGKRSVLFEG